MRNKNLYRVDFKMTDAKGRTWGNQTITGTMQQVCKDLAINYQCCMGDFTFRVKKLGKHKDNGVFSLQYFNTDFKRCSGEPFERFNLIPSEYDERFYGWNSKGQWRQEFAETLDRTLWPYDCELTGYYF